MSPHAPVRLCIALPVYGAVPFDFVRSLLNAQALCSAQGIPLYLISHEGDSLIPHARVMLVHQALSTDATHILMIDTDLRFDAQDILRMLDHDVDVITGLYPYKRVPTILRPSLAIQHDGEGRAYVARHRDAVAANDVLLGFALIKRRVFLDLRRAHPENCFEPPSAKDGRTLQICDFFPTGIDPVTRQYRGEDFGFSRLCREAGVPMWIDTKSTLGHVGTHRFECPPLNATWTEDSRRHPDRVYIDDRMVGARRAGC